MLMRLFVDFSLTRVSAIADEVGEKQTFQIFESLLRFAGWQTRKRRHEFYLLFKTG